MSFTLVNESIDFIHTCTMVGYKHIADWEEPEITIAPSTFSTSHQKCNGLVFVCVFCLSTTLDHIKNTCSMNIQCKMMSSRNSIAVFLLLLSMFNNGMAKKTAGLVIFRRANAQIEYLMLKPTKDGKVWSPPKGLSITKFQHICLNSRKWDKAFFYQLF